MPNSKLEMRRFATSKQDGPDGVLKTWLCVALSNRKAETSNPITLTQAVETANLDGCAFSRLTSSDL